MCPEIHISMGWGVCFYMVTLKMHHNPTKSYFIMVRANLCFVWVPTSGISKVELQFHPCLPNSTTVNVEPASLCTLLLTKMGPSPTSFTCPSHVHAMGGLGESCRMPGANSIPHLWAALIYVYFWCPSGKITVLWILGEDSPGQGHVYPLNRVVFLFFSWAHNAMCWFPAVDFKGKSCSFPSPPSQKTKGWGQRISKCI